MTLERHYISWLQDMVDPSHSFGLLIDYLYSVAYEWNEKIDENLDWLGRDLREQFMKERDICDMSGMAIVLVHPCSIIEVLCAVAQDIEYSVLGYSDCGHNIALRWFDIIEYLGLDLYFDECFEEEAVKKIVDEELCGNFFRIGFMFSFQKFMYEKYF